VVEVVVVVVDIEPEVQKIAGFWRRRQEFCGGDGVLGRRRRGYRRR
jgi:hypothetical protein